MLNQTQKAAVSALVSGIRLALKKGKARRDEMTKLQTPEALISFVEDVRAEVKETVSVKELAARSIALVSTIASQCAVTKTGRKCGRPEPVARSPTNPMNRTRYRATRQPPRE